ncbi:hypothetical protein DFJ73DRAFT_842391 [Zopfochytrium polystomum]|nr:hypothetical protein DFJ73DRAFT_842391 [Zopfochytrium polystomum]
MASAAKSGTLVKARTATFLDDDDINDGGNGDRDPSADKDRAGGSARSGELEAAEQKRTWSLADSKGKVVFNATVPKAPIPAGHTDAVTIGRNIDCKVPVESSKVSKNHCVILWTAAADAERDYPNAVVEDSSSNGTFVNGVKVGRGNSAEIKNGDVLSLGKSDDAPKYTFSIQDPSSAGNEPTASPRKRKLESDAEEASKSKKHSPEKEETRALESSLTCPICHDLFHVPVSAMPCLHSFCGGCISDWVARSRECPQCRLKIRTISRNHQLKSVVDIFLKSHPEKARDDEDIADLDSKNRVQQKVGRCFFFRPLTGDQPLSLKRDDDDADDDVEDEDEDEDEDESDDEPPPAERCQQCPPNAHPTRPACTAATIHIRCVDCMRLMPEMHQDNQKCAFCLTPHCNNYWPTGCASRLNNFRQLRDFQFFTIPAFAFSSNAFEQGVLNNHLRAKGLNLASVLSDVLAKVAAGTLEVRATNVSVSSEPGAAGVLVSGDAHCCIQCATKIFAEFCYLYRRAIDPTDLPDNVKNREDCWYGRQCRTQSHNPRHAQTRNHVCDATR